MMQARLQSKAASGFTLIEILVVVAIILLLAAILFPVFARARENARRSSCQSNLKQIGLSFEQYVQDWDERYPHNYGANDLNASPYTTNLPFGWADMLDPYLKSTQVLQCPSEKVAATANPLSEPPINKFGYTDYAYNWLFYPQVPPPPLNVFCGLHKSQFTYPANTVMLQDALSGAFICCNSNSSRHEIAMEQLDGSDAATTNYRAPRHLEGNNFLFSDGHVKWFKPGKVQTGVALPGYIGYCGPGGANRPTGSNFTFCYD